MVINSQISLRIVLVWVCTFAENMVYLDKRLSRFWSELFYK